jgi:hypothetical protein
MSDDKALFDPELFADKYSAAAEYVSDVFNEFNEWLNSNEVNPRAAALTRTKLEEAFFWAVQAVTE